MISVGLTFLDLSLLPLCNYFYLLAFLLFLQLVKVTMVNLALGKVLLLLYLSLTSFEVKAALWVCVCLHRRPFIFILPTSFQFHRLNGESEVFHDSDWLLEFAVRIPNPNDCLISNLL